jgi:hypothetical protein
VRGLLVLYDINIEVLDSNLGFPNVTKKNALTLLKREMEDPWGLSQGLNVFIHPIEHYRTPRLSIDQPSFK